MHQYRIEMCFSSISSGVNSIAAVIIEDIWKRLTPNKTLSDQLQTKISKFLCKRNEINDHAFFSYIFSGWFGSTNDPARFLHFLSAKYTCGRFHNHRC